MIHTPRATDAVNSFQCFDPNRPEQIGGSFLRRLDQMDLPPYVPTDDETVWAHWVDYIVKLIRDKKDCVVIVDGTPGEGKSTFALWMCLRVQSALNTVFGASRRFEPERDVCYSLSQGISRIRASTRDDPNVVLFDEAVLIGAQARAGSYDAQVVLDRVLQLSRIQGVTVFFLAPSIWSLSSCVRDRRARLWFHVEHRGLSTAFELREEIPFRRPSMLPFEKARQPWHRIHWDSLESDPIWDPYEGRKIEQTLKTLDLSKAEALRIENKGFGRARARRVETQEQRDDRLQRDADRKRKLRGSPVTGPRRAWSHSSTRARARAER